MQYLYGVSNTAVSHTFSLEGAYRTAMTSLAFISVTIAVSVF